MSLTVVLKGFAIGALAGGNEEDSRDEGLLVGGGLARGREVLADEGQKGGLQGLVAMEGCTEEHEGLEMQLLGRVVEGEVVEQGIGGELLLVALAGLVGLPAIDTPTEDVEEAMLHLTEEIGAEDLVDLAAGDFDIVGRALEEAQGYLVAENGDAEGQAELAMALAHLDDGGIVATEQALADMDKRGGGDVGGNGPEGVLLAVLDEEGDEGTHLLLAEPDGTATVVAQEMQMEATLGVPVFAEEEVEVAPRGLDEHEAVEVATELPGIGGALEIFIRYDVEELASAVLLALRQYGLEQTVDHRGIGMEHHVPIGLVLVETDFLRHILSLPLLRAFLLFVAYPMA